MFTKHETYPAALLELVSVANQAVRAIPPLFPLTSSVAVNPFLGQSEEPMAVAATRLARVAGTRILPERAHFAAKFKNGEITEGDLRGALTCVGRFGAPGLAEVKAALSRAVDAPPALPTIAELAAEVSGIDWPALIEDRIGAWAGSHFDEGQALWQPYRTGGAFVAWREFAARDLTPEIHGLRGFGAFVAATPRNPWRALGRGAEALGLTGAAAETGFHRLLVTLGGWAQYARYLLWQAELGGETDSTTVELLAIRMIFEEALFRQYDVQIAARWLEVTAAHARPVTPDRETLIDVVWQEAAERAAQRALAEDLTGAASEPTPELAPVSVQAAFCIDVRSEVFRRALEAQDAGIRTLGFAGFFGLAAGHRRAGSDVVETRGPVLLSPGVTSHVAETDKADLDRRYAARARRAWGRFKLAAVSSFAFVEATGPLYVGKVLRDALGLGHAHAPEPKPEFDPSLGIEARAGMAATVLRAMSLTRDFARIVMLAGHGASVTYNAHSSTLQCGACGGHAGDVNARLLAGLLNDAEVRARLVDEGIDIPKETLFVAALHDTTTDEVTLYDQDNDTAAWADDIERLRVWLVAAGRLARTERASGLPRATTEGDIARRARDWADLRPEWGLAGCRAFVAAPRGRTVGASLSGQSFLHSYDWRADEGFGVLELIMTAPVVVASWISLQYYGSAVAPSVFGGGNKLLHNVTGGIGVLEGNVGVPRAGLPWQSVHDGETLRHDPLRLTVVIEAPTEAMSNILDRHPQVRALFDNRWLHLVAMDDEGRMAWRYDGQGGWTRFGDAQPVDRVLAAE